LAQARPPTRPLPADRSSPFITPAGKQRLEKEAIELVRHRREVTAALGAAAAEGDRSENAEYQYRKKQLAGIDRRLRYLQRRFRELRAIADTPTDRGRVYFGAWVELEEHDGGRVRYRIVGVDEIDARQHWISIDSPMARSLLGCSVGQRVIVVAPAGQREFRILGIEY